MMQDTGEDALRQRPNVVATFFKRLGQVHVTGFFAWLTETFELNLIYRHRNSYLSKDMFATLSFRRH